MRNDIGRDYLSNPRQFDGWLKANAVFGLVLTIGMLAMAMAGSIRRDQSTWRTWRQNYQVSLPPSECAGHLASPWGVVRVSPLRCRTSGGEETGRAAGRARKW